MRKIKYDNGQPCKHRGCLSHISHPCEGCGRISGKGIVCMSDDSIEEITIIPSEENKMVKIIDEHIDNNQFDINIFYTK